MNSEEFLKDISLKNSINIANTLFDLMSNKEKFDEFKANMNKYIGNRSMQKFTWNREMNKHMQKLLASSDEIEKLCTKSSSISIADVVKHSYKSISFIIHTDIPLTYEERTFVRKDKHIYSSSLKMVNVEADTSFEIHKFNLIKILLEYEYCGVLENAKLKVPNNNFPNGIMTPFDIFNKCVIQLN